MPDLVAMAAIVLLAHQEQTVFTSMQVAVKVVPTAEVIAMAIKHKAGQEQP